ncbi:MAG TPA: helix-hairpin-helix domain-containing protein [Methylotenera sp.]|nr:helix-hairpin-helix domain-containing protein [Methylotenera sp.]HPH05588.1 helix-hairpin-helix domain-containing protein [Methylotenera sp.]HPM99997.1 helix-hairpin-helix domain-containing protein [Methylotenera sp.]
MINDIGGKSVAAANPATAKPAAKAKKDDLTIVEGIGPKIAELLIADGIVTFADLANAKVEAIAAILAKAGSRYSTHKPDTWPQQAALARDGKMDELKALQDALDGGKVK